MSFDCASNAIGHGVGAVLVSPSGKHYPLTARLEFECTNNVAEYEACVLGLQAVVEKGIKKLKVYGDSSLVIYQLGGEWETKDPKLVKYRKMILEIIKGFEEISFNYQPREENLMADALATLASMFRANKEIDMKPIRMNI